MVAVALAVTLAGSVVAIRFLPIVVVLALLVLALGLSGQRWYSYVRSRRVVFIPAFVIWWSIIA